MFPDYAQDLYVVSTVGENNEPLRLTNDLKTIHNLAWSADGKYVYYTSVRTGENQLWRVLANGGLEAASADGK